MCQKLSLLELFYSKLQASKLQPSALRIFKFPVISLLLCSYVHQQVLTGSIELLTKHVKYKGQYIIPKAYYFATK